MLLSFDTMPEAEVALRFAFYLLTLPNNTGKVTIAIDGAQVRNKDNIIFPIEEFLKEQQWVLKDQTGKNPWQGSYERNGQQLEITSKSGIGDVTATIRTKNVYAECKKGSLKDQANQQYPLIREAIGQLMTKKEVGFNDVMAVVVPAFVPFKRLCDEWREYPLIKKAGIQLVTIDRVNVAEGLIL